MPKIVEVPGVGNVEFPDSMNDQDIAAQIQKSSPQQAPASKDTGFFSGLHESTIGPLMQFAHGMIKDPLNTLKNTSAGLQKALIEEPWHYAGKTGEAMVHGDVMGVIRNAPGMVPLVGPAAEQITDMAEAGQPGRAAGNAVGLLGAAALPEVAGATTRAAPRAAAALEKSAVENYRSILLPTKKGVTRAEQTAAGLAEEQPIALTQGGLIERAAQEKTIAGPKAGAAYDNVPPVPAAKVQQVFDDLESMRRKNATIDGPQGTVVVNEPFNAAVDNFKTKLQEMQDWSGQGPQGSIPAAVMDDWRDKLFRGQIDSNGNLKAMNPASAKGLEKGVANSIRKVLDEHAPDAKMLNDTYKLWANTYDFLEDARRAKIASKRGITVGSSQGFGALVQRLLPRPVREIPATLTGVFDSVAWNTVSGAMKNSIADALSGGQWSRAESLLKLAARGQTAAASVGARNLQPATATQQ